MAGLAVLHSRAQVGMRAVLVGVEVHVGPGLPSFTIVGLPEAAVRESKDRVRAAIVNSGLDFPDGHITVNLAPADLPKDGGRFDLPIALGVLAASDQIPLSALSALEFVGELALGGNVRAIRAVLPAIMAAHQAGRVMVVPAANAVEAGLVDPERSRLAERLSQVLRFLHTGDGLLSPKAGRPSSQANPPDLVDVRGQQRAKRALEIAAAGRHNLLLSGPPGTGKSLLASRLPGILPRLRESESLEVAAVASVLEGDRGITLDVTPPIRSPHHSSSVAALAGGGCEV